MIFRDDGSERCRFAVRGHQTNIAAQPLIATMGKTATRTADGANMARSARLRRNIAINVTKLKNVPVR